MRGSLFIDTRATTTHGATPRHHGRAVDLLECDPPPAVDPLEYVPPAVADPLEYVPLAVADPRKPGLLRWDGHRKLSHREPHARRAARAPARCNPRDR